MSPSSKQPRTSLTPSSCVNEHLLGMLLWAFSSALSSIVFKNTYTLNTCTTACLLDTTKVFVAQTGNIPWGGSCHPWWCTLLWFILKKHKSAIEFLYSTRSSKLPLWLDTPSIDCEEQRKWCTHETNRISEQTHSPHICLKVVCRKGRRIFVSLWHIYMLSLTDLIRYAGDNFSMYTHPQIDVCKDLLQVFVSVLNHALGVFW